MSRFCPQPGFLLDRIDSLPPRTKRLRSKRVNPLNRELDWKPVQAEGLNCFGVDLSEHLVRRLTHAIWVQDSDPAGIKPGTYRRAFAGSEVIEI